MKIALASDLHLEFGDIELKNTEHADVLILAGDVCVIDHFRYGNHYSERYFNFFKRVSEEFPQVIYILGNHEFYDYDIPKAEEKIKYCLNHLPNVHILCDETYTLDGYTFIGGTLWTDCNNEDPLTLHAVEHMMHDFRCIHDSSKPVDGTKKFLPKDAAQRNHKFLDYIDAVIGGDGKYVVVGHHGATHRSIDPKYANAGLINHGFVNDLEDYIAYREKILLWVHGHTHDPFDYVVGTTRVCANPRGYIGHEPQAETFQLKYIDL